MARMRAITITIKTLALAQEIACKDNHYLINYTQTSVGSNSQIKIYEMAKQFVINTKRENPRYQCCLNGQWLDFPLRKYFPHFQMSQAAFAIRSTMAIVWKLHLGHFASIKKSNVFSSFLKDKRSLF